MARCRGWCFTIHDCSKGSFEKLQRITASYLIVGDEVAPSTGKQHYQGYVHFANVTRFAAVRKMLPEGTHIEPARGSALENKVYCSKEKVLMEVGEVPKQGKRNDIEVMRALVADGGNMRAACAVARSLQGIKIAEKLLTYDEAPRQEKPWVAWFWGPTGTGKSRAAAEALPDAWWSGKNLRWWQGYDAHDEVIIDDFRGDFCTFHELLRILDRYPFTVEVKGGSRQLVAKKIIITSCAPPERVYKDCGEKVDQLLRRLDEVREFGTEVSGTEVGGVILDPPSWQKNWVEDQAAGLFEVSKGT